MGCNLCTCDPHRSQEPLLPLLFLVLECCETTDRLAVTSNITLKLLTGQRLMLGCGGEARDSRKTVPFKGAICKIREHDPAEAVNLFACIILGFIELILVL